MNREPNSQHRVLEVEICLGCFHSFAPQKYYDYVKTRKAIGIPGICPTTAFAKFTINFGATYTNRHRDKHNDVTGGCDVYVLGDFAWWLGGHLILEEAGVILELAPGDNIIFPSASITHYNIPIQPGEKRYSIVGYSAGMLARHVLLQTEPFLGKSKKERDALLSASARERVEAGWARYSTLADLRGKYGRKGQESNPRS